MIKTFKLQVGRINKLNMIGDALNCLLTEEDKKEILQSTSIEVRIRTESMKPFNPINEFEEQAFMSYDNKDNNTNTTEDEYQNLDEMDELDD